MEVSTATLSDGFGTSVVDVGETTIFIRRKGEDPPLLLLHGFPQTHLMLHRVAAALAEDFTIVCADLRGYGSSGKPASKPDHLPYSKRVMALDMVRLMEALGFARFRWSATIEERASPTAWPWTIRIESTVSPCWMSSRPPRPFAELTLASRSLARHGAPLLRRPDYGVRGGRIMRSGLTGRGGLVLGNDGAHDVESQLLGRPGAAEIRQLALGLPFLIDIDAIGLDRVRGYNEVPTTRCAARPDYGFARGREEGLATTGDTWIRPDTMIMPTLAGSERTWARDRWSGSR
jgi:hypothetical protein